MKHFIIKQPDNPGKRWDQFINWLNAKTGKSCAGETMRHYGIAHDHKLIAQHSEKVPLRHYNLKEQPPTISLEKWYTDISDLAPNIRETLSKQLENTKQFTVVREHPRCQWHLQAIEIKDNEAKVITFAFNRSGTVLMYISNEVWEYEVDDIKLTKQVD